MATRDDRPNGAPTWIELFTSDVPQARAFYGDLLGWTSSDPDPQMGGYFNFSKDGTQVAGGMANDGSHGQPDAWTTYLATEDAAATCQAAAAAGGQVHLEPMAVMDLGIMAMVADPGGAAVGIWQPGTFEGFGVLAEPGAAAWFELHTRDHDGSVAFYRAVFGWDTHVMSDTADFRYTTLGEGDDAVAGIIDASGYLPEALPGGWSIYFGVADTDASAAKAAELGGTVVRPAEDTPYGRLAELTDPTGIAFRIVQS